MKSWEYITKVAIDTNGMSNREKVSFHYFNEYGLVARKRRNDETITEMVEGGLVPTGWHIAYGGLHYTWTENLIALHRMKRVNRSKLLIAIHLLTEDCERQEKKIAERKGTGG